jgi:uncharacterized membrane protein
MTTDTTVVPTRIWRRPGRLGARARKVMLVTHIIAGGVWLGLDAAFAVLFVTALSTDDPGKAAACYQVLEIVVVWPMLTAGLVSLVSGVTLGLGSRYGLVRYWWVAVKLVINLLFVTLILIGLGPEVHRVADLGRQLAQDPSTDVPVGNLAYPLVVGPALLLTAMLLSVFKPWGRIRGRRQHPRAASRPPGPQQVV